MAGLPSVTTVIPCYNYGHFLERAVRSALDQPGVDARVVIVDDASPDGSGKFAERLAAGDDRISVIRHEQNKGHIATYNDGFAVVDTEFVTLVSADDLVARGALTRAIAVMQRNPRVGLVYGRAVRFRGEPPIERDRSWLLAAVWPGIRWARAVARRATNPILSPEAVLRTAALRQIGGYNAQLPHAGDLEYWLRTALAWDVARVVGPAQAFYREHDTNMHNVRFGSGKKAVQLFDAFAPLLSHPATANLLPRLRRRLAAPLLRVVERLLVVGHWSSELDELVAAAGAIWPEWRLSRRWSAFGQSLDRRADGLAPSAGSVLRAWVPANLDRLRFKLEALVHRSPVAAHEIGG
ncbi:hypothetical protein GCM10022287_00480 [Gryllotalpicola koreensis]|uniref:Glycosyltransferase 2-like domain-containing protein n=1 Tax=Gryllotalpicola koreensis TaxID=993086 RepID=A0ABP7ZPF9_9MICO